MVTVTAAQLAAIMGGDIDYSQHVAAANEAMRRAQCSTVLRQAMFLAQIGHESAGLKYFREIDPAHPQEGDLYGRENPAVFTRPSNPRR